MTEYLRIGFIARPHGIRGAVKLDPLTDDVARFQGLTEGYLELHGAYAPVRLSVLSKRPDAVVKTTSVNTWPRVLCLVGVQAAWFQPLPPPKESSFQQEKRNRC